ncbi:MAG TPA: FG-GAP-like repeat-containing protein [Thermoplasmata archaeon]|nr:FG-GAP-like repeat-containing protein [Thermoplasmata archaeon]
MMKNFRPALREDRSAVSEVIGTILILGMTVSLFAVIIIWVSSFPTPAADTRLELDGVLVPIKDQNGIWTGVNITITHRGGESLGYAATRVYLTYEKSTGARNTEILRLKGTIAWGPNAGTPYGLIDGRDDQWNINERWSITNKTIGPLDKVTADVVDISRSTVMWSEAILGPAGSHPPIFLEKWADRDPETTTFETPQTGSAFTIYARVADEDADLKSVNATLTIYYGTPDPCRNAQTMYDDGTNGDLVKGDGVWTLQRECMVPTNLSWDGSIVLFSATDGNFTTESRMVLHVVLGPAGEGGDDGGGTSGRPPNLRYNGLQGYNIFNATQWDSKEFSAKETRTFIGNERVVIVVGSLLLRDIVGRDVFYMFDPFSGAPPDAVVYGTSKTPSTTTKPTHLQAFRFYKQVNGYNIFLYRFDLNNASSVGINFLRNPVHPPNYFFARYSVTIDLIDSQGTRFNTTDAVNITDTDGYMRQFPLIETYNDSGYTQKTNKFASTDRVYVAVSMFTVDPTYSTVTFGTVQIRDFLGGVQVFRAFPNGHDYNAPLCNPNGACRPPDTPTNAIVPNGPTTTYRFMINLTLASDDPWIEGSQNYAFQITYIDDADETYGSVAAQLVITAPLFRLDVVGGNGDTTNPAWGTHDYGYYYENLNGLDKWRKTRFEFCGLQGAGNCKNAETHSVAFLDADTDGDLDITASVKLDQNSAEINYYRRDLDFDGNVVFSKFILTGLSGVGVYCNDIATGDLTGDRWPEIVCGLSDGKLWYFKNDGTWTSGAPSAPVKVDETRAQTIWGVTIGDFDRDGDNDIAVARTGGTVTYYLNLDGLGTFSTGGITDRWFAEAEVTQKGTLATPDYLKTVASDDVWEQIQEAPWTEPSQNGATTNPSVDAAAAPWAYLDWESGANALGEWHNTGGNPNGLIDVHANWVASTTVSGYWYQSFTVSGSSPFTASVQFDRKVSQIVAGASVVVYVFVDTTNGAPSIATAIASYTHTATSAWISSGTITVPSSRMPAAGTYYLKLAARVTNPASGSGTTIAQLDNAQLSWSSTGGSASEMEHYWRMQQIPNRPLSSYSLRIEAHRSASTDGDTSYQIAYSTNVVGGDPTTGAYTPILSITSTTDTAQTYGFIQNLQNLVVWIRVLDLDHHVGNNTLDSLYVDQMYIEVTTQPIQPGAVITLPGTPGDARSIDADDQDGDGYFDIVVGTAQGRVFKLVGFAGGLQTPAGAYYTVTGNPTIVGIKLANITTSSTGLEIVIAYTTNVRILSGNGLTGTSIALATTTAPATINALGAGDVDGDGDDDVVVAMAGGGTTSLAWYRNLVPGTGTSWTNPPYRIEDTAPDLFDLDLGDGNKSQYLGR